MRARRFVERPWDDSAALAPEEELLRKREEWLRRGKIRPKIVNLILQRNGNTEDFFLVHLSLKNKFSAKVLGSNI